MSEKWLLTPEEKDELFLECNSELAVALSYPDRQFERASSVLAKAMRLSEEAQLAKDEVWYNALLKDYKRVKADRARLMDEAKALKYSDVRFACLVLNIMFYKVPSIAGDESGQWWEAELRDKNIPIKWDKDLGEFYPAEEKGSSKHRLDSPDREKIGLILEEWLDLKLSYNELLDKLLALVPDEEEIRKQQYCSLKRHYDIAMKVAVEVAKHEERERVIKKIGKRASFHSDEPLSYVRLSGADWQSLQKEDDDGTLREV